MHSAVFRIVAAAGAAALLAAGPGWPSPSAMVRYGEPTIAIEHVRVIDGTGAPSVADETVVIEHGKIAAVGPASTTVVPANATAIDASGETLTPGFVGTHDHLYYVSGGPMFVMREMPYSFPRLYLAAGVTTIRTTGSVEPYTDLRVKRAVDAGQLLGPHLDVTSPYMTGFEPDFIQMGQLRSVQDARRSVAFWADRGVTSFKLYMQTPPDIARAVIEAAHARGLKVAGHLCSIGFTRAAEMGIDSLEHGFLIDTEFYPNKKPGICPQTTRADLEAFANLSINDPRVRRLFRTMIVHHVALSSTLAVFEGSNPPPMRVEQRNFTVEDAESAADVMRVRGIILARPAARRALWHRVWEKELQLEAAFYREGGLLTQGPDPTGYGASLAGFGDQRDMELLVQAGLTPVQAIHVATENGAILLGRQSHVGTIEPGMNADLVLIDGNPAANIDDVERVRVVFKDGVGYDSARILQSIKGLVGRQ
jgi:imidazolonepropionase-like amidohydrolase